MGAQKKNFQRFCLTMVALGSVLLHSAAFAASPNQKLAELSSYTGGDREQKLLDAAKEEGELTLYTSVPVKDMSLVTDAFTKKYGVRVNLWRAGSEKVLQRTITEARSGHPAVDVIHNNSVEMEAAHREGLLQKVNSPVLKTLIPMALTPHGEWAGHYVNFFVQSYNTDQLQRAELPKQWKDLTDPKWKGKLGIEAGDLDWFSAVLNQVGGEEEALALFREIVRKNGISVRKGHTLLAKLAAAGEVPLALTVYSYKADQLKNQGAPTDWFVIGKPIGRMNSVGVAKAAPHPAAALLFYDFLLSEEGQKIMADQDYVATSKAIANPIKQLDFVLIEPSEILDRYSKWNGLYNEIFINQAR
jgi:iron(III) transport system substrate-binding protein